MKQSKTLTTTLSSKSQVTLPASVCRNLGLQPGDKLAVTLEGEHITLTPKPRSYTEAYGGKLRDFYGTADEIEAYLKDVRSSWEKTG
jgi:AbrB family looped-hinge helix DNA binding protein